MNSAQQEMPIDQNKIEKMQQQEAQRQQNEEMKNHILGQILTAEARERLSNIKLVRPDKAQQIEMQLIQAAQSGKLPDKITEQQLIAILDKIDSTKPAQSKVTFQRRKLSSDEDI